MKSEQQMTSGHLLTTGGLNDPLLPKLLQAINNATEIAISVSFVQSSGVKLLIDALVDALRRGATLKLLTSDYLGITDPTALRELRILQDDGAQVRIFNCDPGQSFHMKSYIFVRAETGYRSEGCAYVGSNNISKAALTHGLEWCLRYDAAIDHPEFVHIREQFNQIFNHPQAEWLSDSWISDYIKRRKPLLPALRVVAAADDEPLPASVVPNEAQVEALQALVISREAGYQRGLVVMATGMGKTWLAAFDAVQARAERVLFVAHREEILIQAARTFVHLMPKKSVGYYNGQQKQQESDLLFASVQTLGRESHLRAFTPDFFDYIIVDEFHHAEAPSYRGLLNYFKPKFLLGLTATPERTDQADILQLCDNNLVFERNLVDGIESKILVPFHYYGIQDETVDYQSLPWRSGRFDPNDLTYAFATNKRASHITEHWQTHHQQRTLAFCVSRKHADYMADWFNSKGISSAAIYAGSSLQRNEALQRLENGELKVLFCVDLFNEGTDLPSIDTVLILRPTESKILFLQQLGRGLRRSDETGKKHLVVLDFIGNHKVFLNRPMALLGSDHPGKMIARFKDNPELVPGCFVNIAPQLLDFWQKLVRSYQSAAQAYQGLHERLGRRPTASEFYYDGFDLAKMRRQHGSWFELVAGEVADDEPISAVIVNPSYRAFLHRGLETASMAKSFKGILLEAFLELDGLRQPPTTQKLAEHSWQVFQRYPKLKKDIKADLQGCEKNDPRWHKYWCDNPIKFLCKQDAKDSQAWFALDKGVFRVNIQVREQDYNTMQQMMQELVALLLARYSQRQPKSPAKVTKLEIPTPRDVNVVTLPFFPDLKIACGHFKEGQHDEVEDIVIQGQFGTLDPTRHFVACASGNSMNGGKNPIVDGDHLLLEFVTPTSAGSISGQTMAIEQTSISGDEEYLLRVVHKVSNGKYRLKALNPDYEDIDNQPEFRTLARLKAVLKPEEILP